MKNFNKFTVGALMMIGSLALTSCVDDEISSEVQAIYENQAAYLGAQAALEQAEADIKAADAEIAQANVAVQAAIDTAEIAEAQARLEASENALALAREAQIAALIGAKASVESAKSANAEGYLADYLGELGTINGLTSAIAARELQVAALEASDVDGVFTNDEAIAKKNLDIAILKDVDLVSQQNRLALLEAIEGGTSSASIVLGLQEQIDVLQQEQDARDQEIIEIQDTELSYGTDLSDYTTAVTDVEGYEAAVQTATDGLADAQEYVTEAEAELAELTGGVAISHADALAAKSAAQATFDVANDEFMAISGLAADYDVVIADIAAADALRVSSQELVTSLTTDLAILNATYSSAQAQFNADPSGNQVTDAGVDESAGDPNDTFATTYREVLTVGTPSTYGPGTPTLPTGGVIGTAVGEFTDVEADDSIATNESVFMAAQNGFIGGQVALSNAQADLDESILEIAELQVLAAEFDTTAIAGARIANDEAEAALTLATDVVTAITAVTTAENAILTEEKAIADANQNLGQAESEVARLLLLIDPAALAAFEAIQDQIDALTLENALSQLAITELEGDIMFAEETDLDLKATDYAGSDFEERMEAIATAIYNEQVAILATQKSIALEEDNLKELAQENVELVQDIADQIASLDAMTADDTEEIAQRQILAANFLALMNEALAAI